MGIHYQPLKNGSREVPPSIVYITTDDYSDAGGRPLPSTATTCTMPNMPPMPGTQVPELGLNQKRPSIQDRYRRTDIVSYWSVSFGQWPEVMQ